MSEVTFDYHKPSRLPRRWKIALVIASIALGISLWKLSDKWRPEIENRFALWSLQREILREPWSASIATGHFPVDPANVDVIAIDLSNEPVIGRWTGDHEVTVNPPLRPVWFRYRGRVAGAVALSSTTVFVGQLNRPDGVPRLVGVELFNHAPDLQSRGSIEIMAVAIELGTLWSKPRMVQPPRVSAVTRYGESAFIIAGKVLDADPQAAEFSLVMDGIRVVQRIYIGNDDKIIVEPLEDRNDLEATR